MSNAREQILRLIRNTDSEDQGIDFDRKLTALLDALAAEAREEGRREVFGEPAGKVSARISGHFQALGTSDAGLDKLYDLLDELCWAVHRNAEATGRRAGQADLWLEFVHPDRLLCGLCGNHGAVITDGLRSPAGVLCGVRRFCICPNGRALKEKNADLDWWAANAIRARGEGGDGGR